MVSDKRFGLVDVWHHAGQEVVVVADMNEVEDKEMGMKVAIVGAGVLGVAIGQQMCHITGVPARFRHLPHRWGASPPGAVLRSFLVGAEGFDRSDADEPHPANFSGR